MMKSLFFLFLLTVTVINLRAGIHQTDSLWATYHDGQKTDSVRFAALMNLGNKVYRNQKGDLDSAEVCFRFGIQFAEQKSSKKYLASAYNNLGTIKQYKNQFDSAIYYREKSAMLYKELEEFGLAAGVLSNLAASYGALSNYVKTLQYLNESLTLLNKTDNTVAKLAILFNMALTYSDLNYLDQAEKCYLDILEIYETIPKDQHYSMASLNLASIYVNSSNYENAEHYLKLALENAQNIKDASAEKLVLIHLGDIYLTMEKYEQADIYYQKAVNIQDGLYEDLAYCKYYYGQSLNYSAAQEWGKALNLAEKSYSYAKEMMELKLRYNILFQIYEMHKKLGHSQKALSVYEEYIELLDSNTSIENKEAAIRFKYQIDYREKQVRDSLNYLQEKQVLEVRHEAKLERELYFKYLLVAALIILTLGLFLLIQRYTHKKKQLHSTSKKLHYSNKDLEKVAEITKSKHEQENDLAMDIRETLPLLESKNDQKLIVNVLKKRNWTLTDWAEENQFLQDIALGSSEFEEKLKALYPDLSKTEIELCRYLKAGFGTKKISLLRNISVEAVQKAKHRLRKKLKTKSGADLYEFMQQID